jgi:hypothetical protein
MFTGGRVGCCDHGSEEGKTIGNNVRAWWKTQNKRLEQGNLKRIDIQEIAQGKEKEQKEKKKGN